MKFIRELFSKRTKKQEVEDVVTFAREIEKRIDRTSLEIFRTFKTTLLTESNIYIVPAVWGAVKEGDLTDTQRKIHAMVSPVIMEILDSLQQDNLDTAQNFAIAYLVRGFFISKIIYMIEFYKNLSGARPEFCEQITSLKDVEPMGHA
ncbi:MAG: hypothetical protein GY749_37640 [Desulfobacteraceae bacterium]|nr:hypothetical protein [Desulfobacteraceae bacterium]